MITVELIGGLGSQLHKYAVAYAAASELSVPLRYWSPLSQEPLAPDDRLGRVLAIQRFTIGAPEASPADIARYMGGSPARSVDHGLAWAEAHTSADLTVLRNRLARGMGSKVLRVSSAAAYDDVRLYRQLVKSGEALVRGEWTLGVKLFDHLHDELRIEFTVKDPLPTGAHQFIAKARSPGSIAVHVRRGDYLTEVNKNLFTTRPATWYAKAVEVLVSRGALGPVLLFSDDQKWVVDQLLPLMPTDALFVSGLQPEHDFELIRSCEHKVISNSSFSLMAAWLGDDHSSQVIAPSQWFVSERLSRYQAQQLPQHWTLL